METNETNQPIPEGTPPASMSPNMSGLNTTQESHMDLKPEKSGKGPIIGAVIIIIILIIGGLYVWKNSSLSIPDETGTVGKNEAGTAIEMLPDGSLNALESQSSADDLGSIEADVLNTDFSNLDEELGVIETELGGQ